MNGIREEAGFGELLPYRAIDQLIQLATDDFLQRPWNHGFEVERRYCVDQFVVYLKFDFSSEIERVQVLGVIVDY